MKGTLTGIRKTPVMTTAEKIAALEKELAGLAGLAPDGKIVRYTATGTTLGTVGGRRTEIRATLERLREEAVQEADDATRFCFG